MSNAYETSQRSEARKRKDQAILYMEREKKVWKGSIKTGNPFFPKNVKYREVEKAKGDGKRMP